MKTMKIRLALREEGTFWNAYLALADTMEGAKVIGSISIGAVRKNPKVRADFMALMKLVLADAIENLTGKAPEDWHTGPASEAERTGNA
jgi:hypothetical protein